MSKIERECGGQRGTSGEARTAMRKAIAIACVPAGPAKWFPLMVYLHLTSQSVSCCCRREGPRKAFSASLFPHVAGHLSASSLFLFRSSAI